MDQWDGIPESDRETTADVLARQDDLASRWHGTDRLRFSYTLRTIFNCSDQLITATVERAAWERAAGVAWAVLADDDGGPAWARS